MKDPFVSPLAAVAQAWLRHRRRLSSAVGVIALAILVLVLGACAGPDHTTTATTATVPTSTPSSQQEWELNASLASTKGLPVLAPSDPKVVYQLFRASDTAPVTLRRSEDRGASWHELPLPSGSSGGITSFVSPLNSQQVFLEVVRDCPVAQAGNGGPLVGRTPGGYCSLIYGSHDGGDHWTEVAWPTRGFPRGSLHFGFLNFSPFQAQEQRLYAHLHMGAQGYGALVVSSDGGATWQFADQALIAQQHCVLDAAALPGSSQVFAVTVDHCQPDPQNLDAPYPNGQTHFWRSDDAGAHWVHVRALSYVAGLQNLFAVRLSGRAQPVLYDGGVFQSSDYTPPAEPRFSLDGGATWQIIPLQSRQIHAPVSGQGILGVLSDGSILEDFGDGVYAWKVGDAGWRQVAPALPSGSLWSLLVAPAEAGGPETLYLITTNAQFSEYSVYRFALS